MTPRMTGASAGNLQQRIDQLERLVSLLMEERKVLRQERTQRPMGVKFVLGKANASIAKNASGGVSVWAGAPGSETDTLTDITAYNKIGAISSGKWVICAYWHRAWYVINAEC